jgi:hypothetical protein
MAAPTCAAWLGALRLSIERLGLRAPAAALGEAPDAAYRALVHAAWAQGGWIALPRLGQALPRVLGWTFAPNTAPSAVLDAAAHWLQARQGLAAVHSRAVTPGQASLQRSTRPANALHAVQDDLLALGLAAASLERAAWADVQVWVAGVPVFPWADESALARLAAAGATAKGLITWVERPQAEAMAAVPAAAWPNPHPSARLM